MRMFVVSERVMCSWLSPLIKVVISADEHIICLEDQLTLFRKKWDGRAPLIIRVRPHKKWKFRKAAGVFFNIFSRRTVDDAWLISEVLVKQRVNRTSRPSCAANYCEATSQRANVTTQQAKASSAAQCCTDSENAKGDRQARWSAVRTGKQAPPPCALSGGLVAH